jgi:hypothetical protein
MLFDEKDYTGTYPYVADHVIGPYTPANRDHPAYSAPAPGVRYTSSAYKVSNLRPYLGYYYACQNYMILASEPAVLRMDNISEEMFFPAIQDLYEEGRGWVITPNPKILTMNLLEGQPRLIDETLKIVEWNVRFDILPEVQVYRKDTNQVHPITDFDTRGLIRDGAIHGTLRTQFTNEWRPVQFISENSLS